MIDLKSSCSRIELAYPQNSCADIRNTRQFQSTHEQTRIREQLEISQTRTCGIDFVKENVTKVATAQDQSITAL
jgi:hypothetical protein